MRLQYYSAKKEVEDKIGELKKVKDGDNIEVDADNAVVLILRKDKH